MAIPFLDIKCQQRSKGANAVCKAAYNSCSCMNVDGDKVDYTRKAGLVYSELLLAAGQLLRNRQEFWQSVEDSEKRKNSTVSRKIESALPLELDQKQRQHLARSFALHIRRRFDLPAVDLNIHEPKRRKREATAEENPHLHLQFPDRNKAGQKIRELSSPKTVTEIRQIWEWHCNAALKAAGLEERISMKSLEEQIDTLQAEIAQDEKKIATRAQYIQKLEAQRDENLIAQSRSMEQSPEKRHKRPTRNPTGTGKSNQRAARELQGNEGSNSHRPRPDFQYPERDNRRGEAREKRGPGRNPEMAAGLGKPTLGVGEPADKIKLLMAKIMFQLEAWKEQIDLETVRINHNAGQPEQKKRHQAQTPHY